MEIVLTSVCICVVLPKYEFIRQMRTIRGGVKAIRSSSGLCLNQSCLAYSSWLVRRDMHKERPVWALFLKQNVYKESLLGEEALMDNLL